MKYMVLLSGLVFSIDGMQLKDSDFTITDRIFYELSKHQQPSEDVSDNSQPSFWPVAVTIKGVEKKISIDSQDSEMYHFEFQVCSNRSSKKSDLERMLLKEGDAQFKSARRTLEPWEYFSRCLCFLCPPTQAEYPIALENKCVDGVSILAERRAEATVYTFKMEISAAKVLEYASFNAASGESSLLERLHLNTQLKIHPENMPTPIDSTTAMRSRSSLNLDEQKQMFDMARRLATKPSDRSNLYAEALGFDVLEGDELAEVRSSLDVARG